MKQNSRKNLTPEQYMRANKLVAMAISLVYIFLLIINWTCKKATVNEKLIYTAIYVLWFAASAWFVRKHIRERIGTIGLAVGFIMSYTLLVLTTYTASILIIFPVLMIICVYLNRPIIVWGTVASMIVCFIKSVIIRTNGSVTTADLQIINIMFMGSIITMIGGLRAVGLLIAFSDEETDAVQKALDKQKEVAGKIEDVSNSINDQFNGVMDDLNSINVAVGFATNSMNQITKDTKVAASSAQNQAAMTEEIHARLEHTNELSQNTTDTTGELKTTVDEGKEHSVELIHQSDIVDDNTKVIIETVKKLVGSVANVSEITGAILSISNKTNLLALNASIESARAGEAGRGFAVVAEQIRQLAEQTKSSTEQITAIMQELSQVTGETQSALNSSVESIELQREKVKLVHESFLSVEKGIGRVGENVDEMNSEIAAVLEANNVIVENTQSLADISGDMANEATNSAEEMKKLTERLAGFTTVISDTSEKMDELNKTATQE